MNSDRWTLACHESGHAVAALALGGRCDSAAINGDGSGVANCSELGPDRQAYAVASGPAAEYLASETTPPDVPATVAEVTIDVSELLPTSEPIGCFQFASTPTDDALLARWAIANYESDIDRWADRVRFAQHVASKIVDANAEQIILVASELCVRGRLSAADIKTLMESTL